MSQKRTPLRDIKEKFQQAVDELTEHYGDNILGVELTMRRTEVGGNLIPLIDKVYLKYLEITEINLDNS